MAEVKNKIVTVESLKTKHDYDENTYLKKNEAEDTYLSKDDAENTYLASANAMATYLTNENAELTYLSKSEAESVYLTSVDAESVYLNKDEAEDTYLTNANAESVYLNKNDAENVYLSKDEAEDVYLSGISAEDIYLNKSDAENTYLSKSEAEVTYLNKDNVTPCCAFTGEDSTQLITSDEVTIANLTTFSVNTNEEYFSVSDNGVKVLQSGYYQVSASAYLECDNTCTIYIFKNEDELIAISGNSGGIAIAPKVMHIDADDVIYLKVKTLESDGTLIPNSGSTYISIVKM